MRKTSFTRTLILVIILFLGVHSASFGQTRYTWTGEGPLVAPSGMSWTQLLWTDLDPLSPRYMGTDSWGQEIRLDTQTGQATNVEGGIVEFYTKNVDPTGKAINIDRSGGASVMRMDVGGWTWAFFGNSLTITGDLNLGIDPDSTLTEGAAAFHNTSVTAGAVNVTESWSISGSAAFSTNELNLSATGSKNFSVTSTGGLTTTSMHVYEGDWKVGGIHVADNINLYSAGGRLALDTIGISNTGDVFIHGNWEIDTTDSKFEIGGSMELNNAFETVHVLKITGGEGVEITGNFNTSVYGSSIGQWNIDATKLVAGSMTLGAGGGVVDAEAVETNELSVSGDWTVDTDTKGGTFKVLKAGTNGGNVFLNSYYSSGMKKFDVIGANGLEVEGNFSVLGNGTWQINASKLDVAGNFGLAGMGGELTIDGNVLNVNKNLTIGGGWTIHDVQFNVAGGTSADDRIYVTLGSSSGNVIFSGTSATENILLHDHTDVTAIGNRVVFVEKGIKTDGGAVDTTLSVNMSEGRLIFMDGSESSFGGDVLVRNGTMRLDGNAKFETDANLVSVGTLAGAGQYTADHYVLAGTISPDSFIYQNDGTTTGTEVGTMELTGDVLLSGATFAIDKDNVGNDKLAITGKLDFDSDGGKTLLQLQGLDAQDYTIISASLGIDTIDSDNWTDYVTIRIADSLDDKRQAAYLAVSAQDLILTTKKNTNVYLYWNGDTSDASWEIGGGDGISKNWLFRGSIMDLDGMENTTHAMSKADSSNRLFFENGDYVYFTGDAAEEVEVNLSSSSIEVSGMEILSGNYIFSSKTNKPDDAHKIVSVSSAVEGVLASYQLRINGPDTTALFNVGTDFAQGIVLAGGATIKVGHENALGNYDGTDAKGTIAVNDGGGTIHFLLKGDVDAKNRFVVGNDSTLQFVFAQNDQSLTIVGAGRAGDLGGAIFLDEDASFMAGSDANTTITFDGNTADSGGAIYAKDDLALEGNFIFKNNRAVTNGGAIYAEGDLTLKGDMVFTDNGTAIDNAIYMLGSDDVDHPKTLTFDVSDGNIAFKDNGTAVYLNKKTDLHFAGKGGYVLFHDAIKSGGADKKNLTTSNDFTGTVQFSGDSELLGNVYLTGGTFRMTNGSTFDLDSNVFTANDNVTLAGSGTYETNNAKGFTLTGTTLTPDKAEFELAATGAAEDKLNVGESDKIGTLVFDGTLNLSKNTYVIDANLDLGAVESDLISTINANDIKLADKSTIKLGSVTGDQENQTLTIMTTDGNFLDDDGDIINDLGTLKNHFELVLNIRQNGELDLVESAVGSGKFDTIQITDVNANTNLLVRWTGMVNGDWENKTQNWAYYDGEKGVYQDIEFLEGDYVIFDQTASAQTIELTDDWTVAGMEVTGNRTYTFNGTGKSVTGKVGSYKEWNAAIADFEMKVSEGELLVDNATATINVKTDFVGGTVIRGGQVNIGHDEALGKYDHSSASKAGYVRVETNSLIGVPGTVGSDRYAVNNRFELADGQMLAFNIAQGKTLKLGNDIGNAEDGGTILVDADSSANDTGTLYFMGGGEIAFEDGVARNGGAVFSSGGLTLDGYDTNVFFRNNTAVAGGAIHAENLDVRVGNVYFLNNQADNGAAIYILGQDADNKGVLNLNAAGGDLVFDGNTAVSNTHGVVAGNHVDMTIDADGTGKVFFGKDSTNNSLAIALTGGTSTLNVQSGMTIMNADSVNAGKTTVTGGTFFQGSGVTHEADVFELGSTGTLGGSGVIKTISGQVLGGTLDANADAYTFNQTGLEIEQDTSGGVYATMTFAGSKAELRGATFLVDLGMDSGGTPFSDRYVFADGFDATGDLKNKITATQHGDIADGTYFTVIESNETIDLDDFYLDPLSAQGDRHKWDLKLDGADKELQVGLLYSQGESVYWTARQNDATGAIDNTWYAANTTINNWIIDEDRSDPTYFLADKDDVYFTGTDYFNVGTSKYNVAISGHVNAKSMTVNGGTYTFSNAVIRNVNSIKTSDGIRIITEANATYHVDVATDGQLLIDNATATFNASAKADSILADNGATATFGGKTEVVGSVTVQNRATATFAGDLDADSIAVSNNGNATFGNVTLDNDLTVQSNGYATFGGTLGAKDIVLQDNGTAEFNGPASVDSLLAENGASVVSGGSGNLTVKSGDFVVQNNASANLGAAVTVETGDMILSDNENSGSQFKGTVTVKKGELAVDNTNANFANVKIEEEGVHIGGSNVTFSGTVEAGNATNGNVNIHQASNVTFVKGVNTGGDLTVDQSIVNLLGESSIDQGTLLKNATAMIGDDKALGTTGVTIDGTSTIGTTAQAGPLSIANRLTTEADSTLNLVVNSDLTVTAQGGVTLGNRSTLNTVVGTGTTLTLDGAVNGNGQAADSGQEFNVLGGGTVALGGTNRVNGTTSVSENSILQLASGSSLKSTDEFTLAKGSTLTGTGTVEANALNIGGTIQTDQNGNTLSLKGNTNFDESILKVDLSGFTQNDVVHVDGNVAFTKRNTVEINSMVGGKNTYDLITFTGTASGNVENNWQTAWNIAGETRPHRRESSLKLTDDTLQLTTIGYNASLVWNGIRGSMNWDDQVSNEIWLNAGKDDSFMNWDTVLFSSKGQGTVTVQNAGVSVADMNVTGGTYAFEGGAIQGRAGQSSLDGTRGKLTIAESAVTFDNAVDFQGGIEISGRGTSVTQGENGSFKTDGAFTLGEGTSLKLYAKTGSIDADSVNLKGDVQVDLPAERKDATTSKFIASNQALDTNQMQSFFELEKGLFGRSVRIYQENDRYFMDLVYGKMQVRDFGARHGFGKNEMNVSSALDTIFARGEMQRLSDYLYDLTDNDMISGAINTLRGSEQVADSQMAALWSPWRVLFEKLEATRCDCPRDREAKAGGGRNLWLEGYYRYLGAGGDGNARKFGINHGGLMIGMDTRIGCQGAIGITFGYGEPNVKSDFGKIETQDYTAAVYGRVPMRDGIHMNTMIGFGVQSFDSERYGLLGKYDGSYDGYAFYTSFEWVKPVYRQGITLFPLFALDYQQSWTDGFKENGRAWSDAQSFDNGAVGRFVMRAGVNTKIELTEHAKLRTRFQYGYVIAGETNGKVDARFIASDMSPTMVLRGVNVGRNQLNIGIGGEWELDWTNRVRFFIDYDYDYGDRSNAHSGQGGFIVGW